MVKKPSWKKRKFPCKKHFLGDFFISSVSWISQLLKIRLRLIITLTYLLLVYDTDGRVVVHDDDVAVEWVERYVDDGEPSTQPLLRVVLTQVPGELGVLPLVQRVLHNLTNKNRMKQWKVSWNCRKVFRKVCFVQVCTRLRIRVQVLPSQQLVVKLYTV